MSEPKKVLLITYYWPPAGGAGVHRWLRFSNYFKPNGWELTVYCPEDAIWPVRDEELLNEVTQDVVEIRRPIFEPNKYLGKAGNPGVGLSHQKDPGPIKKLLVWIRGNLFIPDARVFWIKPSVKFLTDYLEQHPEIRTIISTGPPHSTHVIALKLKRKFDLHWIADFRDPWTQIDFYDQLSIGKRADAKHRNLELQCLREADEVVTISESCAQGLKELYNRTIHVITNGYVFKDVDTSNVVLDTKFTISHFGSMPESRNPTVLWDVLEEFKKEQNMISSDIEVNLYGNIDHTIRREIINRNLSDIVHFHGNVSHKESVLIQKRSQQLLLIANRTSNTKGILTGKIFEYLAAKRPVIAIGEESSNISDVIKDTESGDFISFDDKNRLKEVLLSNYTRYLSGNLFVSAKNLDNYHSEQLASKFIGLLDKDK